MRLNSSHNTRTWRLRRDPGRNVSGSLPARYACWTRAAQAVATRRLARRATVAFGDRIFLRLARLTTGTRLAVDVRLDLKLVLACHAVAGTQRGSRLKRLIEPLAYRPAFRVARGAGRQTVTRPETGGCTRPLGEAGIPSEELAQPIDIRTRQSPGTVTRTLDRVETLFTRTLARRVVEHAHTLMPCREAAVVFGRRLTERALRLEPPTAVAQVLPAEPRRAAPVHELRESVPIVAVPRTTAAAQQVRPPDLPANVAQITDHVIDQLDRRMRAWRERLGQV